MLLWLPRNKTLNQKPLRSFTSPPHLSQPLSLPQCFAQKVLKDTDRSWLSLDESLQAQAVLAQSLPHLGSAWKAVAPPSPSGAGSPHLHPSSHRRPRTCCCRSAAAPHKQSVPGEPPAPPSRETVKKKARCYFVIGEKKHSSKSSRSISSFRREGVMSSQARPQARQGLDTFKVGQHGVGLAEIQLWFDSHRERAGLP